MKYKFLNDYSEGAHPLILESLLQSNLLQESGYGSDQFSIRAIEKIKLELKRDDVAVHFVAGGTIANLLVIASCLKPFESVIAAESGHINTHEAGAIEATGHKIEYIKTKDGKLSADLIKPLLEKFPLYHTVRPRIVYISNSTEYGTIYSREELQILYSFCQNNNLLLFIDGARLAMALTSEYNDVHFAELPSLCDVFYIGGTKCGALIGEAIVIVNSELQKDFQYHIKQRGAMLAKGRLLGIQFDTLFSDGLLFKLAEHANSMAKKIVNTTSLDYLVKPQTNQLFPILNNALIENLRNDFDFFVWEKIDEQKSAIRLVTSWATKEEAVDLFIKKVAANV